MVDCRPTDLGARLLESQPVRLPSERRPGESRAWLAAGNPKEGEGGEYKNFYKALFMLRLRTRSRFQAVAFSYFREWGPLASHLGKAASAAVGRQTLR